MTERHGLDLEDLRVFRTVAEAGSLTAAATALHYTQSGVSRRIARLERSVGATVFTRLARGVRPTPAGDLLLRHADDVLRRVDVLVEDLEAHRAGSGGRLRIGSFQTAGSSLTPSALARFRRASPDVAITLVEGLTASLLEQVAEGTLDVAVVSDYPTGRLAAADVDLVRLLDDPLLVALPAGHPLARRRRLHLADLADDTWISAGPARDDTVLATAARRAGFTPRVDIRVASWVAKFGYVAAGLGLTLVPGLLAGSAPPQLVLKRLDDDLPPRRVFAALPADRPTAAARAFVAALVETLA